MKLRSLLMGGALFALMGIGIIGCNENPVVDEPVEGAPKPPTELGASSKSATVVHLSWKAAVDTGTISYTVSWSSPGTGGSGSHANLTATTDIVTGLTDSQVYKFSVVAVRSGKSSAADTLTWMGALRYETTLRMYERNSTFGSAIAVDTAGPFLGARNIRISTEPQYAQLAVVVSPDDDSVYVGPAYAFEEYKSVNAFDRDVFAGKFAYLADNIDTWYLSSSLNNLIVTADSGNIKAFGFMATVPGGPNLNKGQGFVIRTGTVGVYNYARVFVKNIGGKFLQGSKPDRYVEVAISYQGKEMHPFAKSGGKDSPIGQTSKRVAY